MLGYVLVTIFFAIMVLVFCWGLLTYLYHSIGCISDKQLNKLRFKSKVAFTLASFWKRMSELKRYPQDTIKGEFGKAKSPEVKEPHDTTSIQEFREKKEKELVQSNKKRYHIKENM